MTDFSNEDRKEFRAVLVTMLDKHLAKVLWKTDFASKVIIDDFYNKVDGYINFIESNFVDTEIHLDLSNDSSHDEMFSDFIFFVLDCDEYKDLKTDKIEQRLCRFVHDDYRNIYQWGIATGRQFIKTIAKQIVEYDDYELSDILGMKKEDILKNRFTKTPLPSQFISDQLHEPITCRLITSPRELYFLVCNREEVIYRFKKWYYENYVEERLQ